MRTLLWKLLRKNISRPQLLGFAAANLLGLSIVLLSVQFYQDVKPVFNDDESFISKDYLIITRSVTAAGAMLGTNSEFSDSDIVDLKNQDWCRRVGKFSSSEYEVTATLGAGKEARGNGMKMQFFFESIPGKFIDIDPDQWGFNPDKPIEVPIIISREYLSLYNFGFASTKGMPKISEGQTGTIPLSFELSGNGHREKIPGRIVGLSNRLNTIVVPEAFMTWSNNRYGVSLAQRPVKLILEVSRPGDVKIQEYMDEHHYEVMGDKMSSSKAYYFLTVIIGVVIVVGLLISLLAFFVLMLSIYLLIQKNTTQLQDLLLLGHTPAELSRPYSRMVAVINLAVLALSLLLMLAGRSLYMSVMSDFGTRGGPVWSAIAVGVVLMAALTAGNVYAIRQKITSLWPSQKRSGFKLLQEEMQRAQDALARQIRKAGKRNTAGTRRTKQGAQRNINSSQNVK